MSPNPNEIISNSNPTAEFTLAAYRITEVVLKNFKNSSETQLYISFDPKGEYTRSTRTYTVSLGVFVHTGEGGEIILSVTMEFDYLFMEGSSLETVKENFYSNFIAIGFPYLRAYISLITSQSQNAFAIILPLLNLIKEAEPLKNNTTYID